MHDTPAEYTDDTVVKFVRAKLLESYKNGAMAARKQLSNPQKPKQKSQTGNHGKA